MDSDKRKYKERLTYSLVPGDSTPYYGTSYLHRELTRSGATGATYPLSKGTIESSALSDTRVGAWESH